MHSFGKWVVRLTWSCGHWETLSYLLENSTVFSPSNLMLSDNPTLLIEPSEMFNAWCVVWEAGIFFNNFIEAYFTYKIHPFQLYISVILVSFLSGKAITILSFRYFPSHAMRSFVSIYMIIPAPSSGQPLIFLSLQISLFWASYQWNPTNCGLFWLAFPLSIFLSFIPEL